MSKEVSLKLRMVIGYIIIFLMTFFVVAAIYGVLGNDYYAHSVWALEISLENIGDYIQNKISYPLWHICVKICAAIPGLAIKYAAAIVTALFNGFAYYAVIKVYQSRWQESFSDKWFFWTTCLMIVNPLYIPWFNQYYYLGQSLPNIWHNPTSIAVKGISILAFGLLIWMLENVLKCKGKHYVTLMGLLFISVFAKPSFMQAFAPGFLLFLLVCFLVERRRFALLEYFKIGLCFVPGGLVIVFQTMATFFNADYMQKSTIGIGWGAVWHNWTPNLFVSALLSFAFPAWVLCFNFRKIIHNKSMWLLGCYEAVAWLEAVLLYESGEKFLHGNFTWGCLLSAFIVWMISLGYFVEDIYEKRENKKKIYVYGGCALFVTHLVCGVLYWCWLMRGESIC